MDGRVFVLEMQILPSTTPINYYYFGTRKAEVLNSLIINTTAKANDTTDY